jgi:hypothetical protein
MNNQFFSVHFYAAYLIISVGFNFLINKSSLKTTDTNLYTFFHELNFALNKQVMFTDNKKGKT